MHRRYKTDEVDVLVGGGGHFVKPSLVFSTDDQTMVIGKCKESGKLEYVLSDIDFYGTTRAAFSTEDHLRTFEDVMRVQLCHTMSGGGQCAAPYVKVKVSEREMPRSLTPSGMIVMEVPGFTGGGAVNPGCTVKGYVVFVRERGAGDPVGFESKVTLHYRKNVLLPLIAEVRIRGAGWRFECV